MEVERARAKIYGVRGNGSGPSKSKRDCGKDKKSRGLLSVERLADCTTQTPPACCHLPMHKAVCFSAASWEKTSEQQSKTCSGHKLVARLRLLYGIARAECHKGEQSPTTIIFSDSYAFCFCLNLPSQWAVMSRWSKRRKSPALQ